MEGHRIDGNPVQFILAGNATVTLLSVKTGVRYTYKVTESDDRKGLYFVKLLTGPDNENDFHYLGTISHSQFKLTKKSRFTLGSEPVKAFGWTITRLIQFGDAPGVEIWHEGRCGRCGRKLTVPSSVATGFGPECATKVAA